MTAPTSPAELEDLLEQAAGSHGDGTAVDRFCAALLDANVGWLLGTNDAGDPAPITVPHPVGNLVPFFTSKAKLAEAVESLERPELQSKVLPCRALWQMAVQNRAGTVLNPFSRYGKNFTVAEMSDLMAGIRPGTRTREVGTETTLAVGTPTTVPPELVTALGEHLRALPGPVERATLAWVRYPDGLQGYLLVIVTDVAREQVTAGIDRAANHTGGETLDVIVQAPAEADDLVSGIAPFWPPAA